MTNISHSRLSEMSKTTRCPHCNYDLGTWTCFGNEEARPKPGTPTLCGNCIALLEFADDGDGNLTIISMSDELMLAVAGTPELKQTIAIAQEIKRLKEEDAGQDPKS